MDLNYNLYSQTTEFQLIIISHLYINLIHQKTHKCLEIKNNENQSYQTINYNNLIFYKILVMFVLKNV